MRSLITIALILGIVHRSHGVSVETYKTYKNYKIYQVEGDRATTLRVLKRLSPENEIATARADDKIQILIAPELTELLELLAAEEKLNFKVLHNDFSQILTEEKGKQPLRKSGFSWTAYYDVDEIYKYLETMGETYPDSAKVVVGGRSYEGRQILGLRINTPVGDREEKPVMFIESGIHAREWITPATTTYFINELLTSGDPNVTALRDQFDWHIFPTVNPDGYHYSYTVDRMWRKTRSRSSSRCFGADPNRNWDYNWLQYGATNDSCDYQTYGGAQPFSEIETRSLATYISGLENMLGYIAFHSDAQCLLVPYSDSTDHNDNYNDLITMGKTSLEYGYQVNKKQYEGPATAAEILYKASGGSMDWVRNSLGTDLVYTYELRGYYFHWPAYRIREQGDEVTQMMVGLLTEAKNLGYW